MGFFAENNRPGFECPPAWSFSSVSHWPQVGNQRELWLVALSPMTYGPAARLQHHGAVSNAGFLVASLSEAHSSSPGVDAIVLQSNNG